MRRIQHGLLLLALALSGGVVAGSGPATAAPARGQQQASTDVTIVTQNTEKHLKAAILALNKADDMSALGVALQEVCGTQMDAIKAHADGYVAYFRKRRSVTDRCGGSASDPVALGEVVLVDKTKLIDGQDPELQFTHPTNEKFGLTCATARISSARKVRICATHLYSGPGADNMTAEEIRISQTAQIRHRVNTWDSALEVVVAGDFNAAPQRAPHDNMYAAHPYGGASAGPMVEVDRSVSRAPGASTYPTHGDPLSKLDYIFFSKNHQDNGRHAAHFANKHSDHKGLLGGFRVLK